MCMASCFLQLCGGKPSEGVFVGAFLSMSSTAVVIILKNLIAHLSPFVLGSCNGKL